MKKISVAQTKRFIGQKVIVGFSGGPDATALAYRLKTLGAKVIPVYINYRKFSGGGKTAKDLQSANPSAKFLRIPKVIQIRAPLGKLPKNQRNRFFVKTLAYIAKENGAKIVALGTIKETDENDLNPEILSFKGQKYGVKVVTWDSFGVQRKSEEFIGMNKDARRAIFKTTSCQMWWDKECGNCYSCVSRHEAFMEAFGHDPTKYRTGSKTTKKLPH